MRFVTALGFPLGPSEDVSVNMSVDLSLNVAGRSDAVVVR